MPHLRASWHWPPARSRCSPRRPSRRSARHRGLRRLEEGRAGRRHHITPADLQAPFTSVGVGVAKTVPQPQAAPPKVPAGFKVGLFASGLNEPRVMRTAPNGDIFVAESEAARIRVLRPADGAARPPSQRGLRARA